MESSTCLKILVLSSVRFVAVTKRLDARKAASRLVAGLIGLACACCWIIPPTVVLADERPPNIVFIVADDLGYGELGCFGQERIRTPNLDGLARQGMRLTQHYSGSPVCAPSRCVLMTGKHPGHAFVRDNHRTPPEGQMPLPESEITLAEILRSQGYVTGGFGKWGLGGPDSTGEPLKKGFDRFFGYLCQTQAHSYYPAYLWDNSQRIPLNNDPPIPGHAGLDGADPTDPRSYDRFKGQDYAPSRINQQALEFIRQNQDRPFLLYYPTILTHLALHVPDEELEPYLELGWEDPPFTRPKAGYTPHFTPRAAYAAMISMMDRFMGNIFQLLDELGLADDTIVVFTSVNGTSHIREEVDFEFFISVGVLRGLMGSLYEGGIRVPTIVRWPGRVTAGSVSDRVTGFEDWFPTLFELIGRPQSVPEDLDGISFAATLLGGTQEPRPFLYREFSGYGGQQSVRVGDWKAVRQEMNRGNLNVELYNLADDIGEHNDVSDQNPQLVEELTTLMHTCRTPSEIFPLRPLDAPAN